MKATLHRKAHLNAAHRFSLWDAAQNARVFGKCSNPHYHGYNYELIVSGPISPDTVMVINVKTLEDIIFEEVEAPFDHNNSNLEAAEFEHLIHHGREHHPRHLGKDPQAFGRRPRAGEHPLRNAAKLRHL